MNATYSKLQTLADTRQDAIRAWVNGFSHLARANPGYRILIEDQDESGWYSLYLDDREGGRQVASNITAGEIVAACRG